jgi:hypothetical protein
MSYIEHSTVQSLVNKLYGNTGWSGSILVAGTAGRNFFFLFIYFFLLVGFYIAPTQQKLRKTTYAIFGILWEKFGIRIKENAIFSD